MRGVARVAWGSSIAAVLALTPMSGLAQDDEPPPWESGAAPGEAPWEEGAPLPGEEEGEPEAETPADEEASEPPAEEPSEPDIPPPGVDTERPYRIRTGEMDSTPVDELGLTERVEDGTTWTVIPFDARGPVAYGAVGYEAGGDLGHMVLTVGGGWTVWGEWEAVRAEGQKPRLHGTATNVLLTFEGAPKVAAGSVPSWLTIGARVQQTVAFGEHLLGAHLGLGGRKDLGTDLGGVDLVFGIAYAFSMPPYAIPVQLDLVRHYSGVFDTKQWGARISVAWPFWFSL